jgi:D-lactate dehydrogenase
MIGGIAANNASGMCCGTAQNSYHTLAGLRVVLANGTVLDTRDAASRAAFREREATSSSGSTSSRAATAGRRERLTARIRLKVPD